MRPAAAPAFLTGTKRVRRSHRQTHDLPKQRVFEVADAALAAGVIAASRKNGRNPSCQSAKLAGLPSGRCGSWMEIDCAMAWSRLNGVLELAHPARKPSLRCIDAANRFPAPD